MACLRFCVAATIILVLSGQASAETLQGRVVSIADGDTITVLDSDHQQHKIRLSGIDAPEKKQPFGQKSKEHLSQLVFNKQVNVVWTKRDRYQRIIGKVMVAEPSCLRPDCPKTLDAGLSQISVGLAWWYRQYARDQSPEDRQRYELAESEAKARKAGLWSEREPVPPWEWRHR
jgi:endonuclease YncB( thermonuclease family)